MWLTPYLLRNLEQHDYGLWLLTAQILFYLALTDVGIVALLPREVAFKTGRAGETLADDLRHLVGETTRLVFWQVPFVALVGLVTWWLVSAQWPSLGGPFAVVVLTFVLTFPLRIFPAVLQGLQDLTFLGGAQLTAWIAGTLLTVALVETGLGIYALAAGWACTQILGAGLAWWRLSRRFPGTLPRAAPAVATARRARTPGPRGVDQREPGRAGPAERHRSPRDRRAAGSRGCRALRLHGQAAHAARESAATVHADGPASLERAACERAASADVPGVHAP